MKKRFLLIPALVLVMAIAAGCRGKANTGNTPSTTTAPTTMPTTMATQPSSAPTQEPSTHPTVDNGNGPLESSGPHTGTEEGTNSTGALEEAQGARSRGAVPVPGGPNGNIR